MFLESSMVEVLNFYIKHWKLWLYYVSKFSTTGLNNVFSVGASLVAQMVKNPPAVWENWFQSLGWEDPLEKAMDTIQVFLPRGFHGQRRLAGCSPYGWKKSDMTEQFSVSFHFHFDFVPMILSLGYSCYLSYKKSQSTLDFWLIKKKRLFQSIHCACGGWLTKSAKWREVKVTHSRLILCDPMDRSPPGSSVHGILQARILAWVAIPFSMRPSHPGIKPESPELQADSLLSKSPGRPKENWRTFSIEL